MKVNEEDKISLLFQFLRKPLDIIPYWSFSWDGISVQAINAHPVFMKILKMYISSKT
jgi:hypothetical protein